MGAVFSECRQYRYRLDRVVGDGPPVAFLLHNPSTAGAVADDATSRRGIGFAQALGFGRLTFINPWARVATKPRDLWLAEDPVGPDNDNHITEAVQEIIGDGGVIIAAWGRVTPPAKLRTKARQRIAHICNIVHQQGGELFALGVNLDGSPKHPLYLPSDATLSKWEGRDSHRL